MNDRCLADKKKRANVRRPVFIFSYRKSKLHIPHKRPNDDKVNNESQILIDIQFDVNDVSASDYDSHDTYSGTLPIKNVVRPRAFDRV